MKKGRKRMRQRIEMVTHSKMGIKEAGLQF